MNSMNILIMLIFWLSAFILAKLISKQNNLIRNCIDGSILALLEYSLLSVLLLWMDKFNIAFIVGIAIIINVLIIIIKYRKNIKSITIFEFGKFNEILLILLILILIPFVLKKSEIIETGCDAGMYMEKAIALTSQNTENQRSLSEYNTISGNVSKELVELQNLQTGLYKYDQNENSYLYEYHGIYIWPAFLALFSWGFGIYNSATALTFLYVLSLLLIYSISEKLCKNQLGKYLAVILFGFSPLILYLAKTTLSEMFLITILLCAVYSFFYENKKMNIFCPLCIGLLGFAHFSTLLYVPLFYIVFLVVGFCENEKKYGYYNILQLGLYALSVFFCLTTSKVYTVGQLQNMFGQRFSTGLMILLIMICVIVGILIQLLAIWKSNQKAALINKILTVLSEKKFMLIVRAALIFLLLVTIYQGYQLGFTDKYLSGEGNWTIREMYAGQGFSSLLRLNIVCTIMATSYVCLPIILTKVFGNKKRFSLYNKVLLVAVVYTLAIYTIIRCDTPSLYYAARYLAIVLVPAIILLTCSLLEQSKSIWIVGCICVITALPFNYVHLTSCGHEGSFEVVQNVTGIIEENSVVLIDDTNRSLNILTVNNLREINSCEVYNDSCRDEVFDFYNDNKSIYIISDKKVEDDRFELLFKKEYTISTDIVSYNGFFPLKTNDSSLQVYVYKAKEPVNLTMNEGDFRLLENFYGLEKSAEDDYFSWTNGNAKISLEELEKKDYQVEIQYLGIPKEVIDEVEQIEIWVADSKLTTRTPQMKGDTISIRLSEQYIDNNGECEIQIRSGTWNPKESLEGSLDNRDIGIPITNVKLEVISK